MVVIVRVIVTIRQSSSIGTVSSNNTTGSISDLLFHATNAGRFPVLNIESALPLSSSPSALMRQIDNSFQLVSRQVWTGYGSEFKSLYELHCYRG